MTTKITHFSTLTPKRVVRGALVAMAIAVCADPAFAQTRPTSTVEVGPGAVGDGSYKAGEYNGLQKQGAYGIGNVDLRGGSAGYNSDTVLRWRIKGNDLGVDTRSLSAEVGQQGRFRLNVGFDQLRRNRSDTYQTPFAGAGSNVLTLPGSWIVPTVAGSSATSTAVNVVSARGLVPTIGTAAYINTATNSTEMGALVFPSAAQMALVNAAATADLPLFHNLDLFTKRSRFDAGFTYNVDQRWAVDAAFRPEHKEGVKPMGTVSRNTGADISTIIPDVIDNDHNQMNASLSFKNARSFAQAAYYGSMYRNNVPFMSWQNWATPTGTVNTMSSTPGNTFNQLSVTAGVNLSPRTKVVANGSYGRNTQNDAFLTDATTPVVPVSSLNGLVITTAFSTRFTSRPVKKLNLTAAYKYDDRDNRTAVNIYQYADAGEAPAANANFPSGPGNPLGAVLAQNANANRPYSRKMNQVNGDADYAVTKGQWIKGGYDFEKIDRACNGSWISCADADTTNEHTIRLDWRASAGQNVSARLGYAYSSRRTPNYNENAFLALVPYANVSPTAAAGGATALSFMAANGWTGYGPALGFAATTGNQNVFFPSNNALANAMYANNNRISELPGMRRYYVADRNRDKVRGSLSWQPTDALSFQGGVDLNRDTYPSSVYGLQDAKSWALNIDGSYAVGADLSATASYTYENMRALTAGNSYTANSNAVSLTNGQPGVVGLAGNGCDGFVTLQQRNNNNKLDPCLNWSAGMLDRVSTAGVGLRKKAGLLDLTGNAIVSRARWDNNVTGGNWANNILDGPGAAPTSIAAFFIAAQPVPTITTNTGELRLSGRFNIDKLQSIQVAYSYLRMTSDDSAYEGMQFGSVSTVLPTNEQAFKYAVNVFGVSYILTF
jgi:MtrB/PioB family decaheme-associated outer membrane protein